MFTLDDMLESLGLGGQKQGRECYREEAANFKIIQPADVTKLFPNVTLSESKQVVYAPFRLCHSLPKINARGRGFTPTTLENSFASVRDGLVNIDHQMKRHAGVKDTICGHLVCGRFDPEGEWTAFKKNLETASKVKVPAKPIPLMALAAFYLQSEHIPALLDEHLSGHRNWLTSMECAHQWPQAAFWYRDEIIPIADAEQGMRECVKKLSVRPFKNHALGLLLGGEAGKVDFHSAAMTPTPADDDAAIEAFVTRPDLQEAANRGDNPFDIPFQRKSFASPGVPEDQQVTVEELASISIMGQTEPAEDGHIHDVLSDGAIMPTNGHTHCIHSWSILKGTTPKFTGRTTEFYEYIKTGSPDYREASKVHVHLLDIPLRGKNGSAKKDASEEYVLANLETVPFYPSEDTMEVQDLLKKIGRVLSSGKYEPAMTAEVSALNTEIANFSVAESLKKQTATEIANKIATGELVTKEEAEKKVVAAAKVEADKAEAEKKVAEARTKRRERVLAIGVDMDAEFNEKTKMKVGEYVDSFGLDENGEKAFEVALATLEQVVKKLEVAETPAAETTVAATSAAAPAGAEATLHAAANKGGGKPATPGKATPAKPAAKKPLLLVGGGTPAAEGEEAAAAQPAKKVGRHLFSTN